MTKYASNVLGVPNLLGLWTMGEATGTTLFDTSGNGNNASLQGGFTLGATPLAVGDSTTSTSLDGSSGYAVFANNTIFNFEWNQPFSVEALIDVTAVPTSGTEGFLLGKESSGSGYKGWMVGIIGASGGQFQMEFLLVANAGGGPNEQLYMKSSILMGAGVHHVLVSYDGSGANTGVVFFVDGVADTSPTTATSALAGNSILTTATAAIGVRGGGSGSRDGYFPGKIQYLALYGASSPDGTKSTSADYPVGYAYNIVAEANASIALLNPNIPTDPGVCNWIIDTDISIDIDDCFDLHSLCYLASQGKGNIVAVTISSSNAFSASCARAVLDYWGLQRVPVYAYQGSALPSESLYTLGVAQRFTGDYTNTGVTSPSVVSGGTGFVVGDTLTVPGGVLVSGASAATLTVLSVGSGGTITTLGVVSPGSYSTAPPYDFTVSCPHVGGSSASLSIANVTGRGNYLETTAGLRKTLGSLADDSAVIIGIGYACNFVSLLSSPANYNNDGLGTGLSIVTAKVKSLCWAACILGKSVYVAESNIFNDITDAQALFADWPTPIILGGVECSFGLTGYSDETGRIDTGPPDTFSVLVCPMYYAYTLYQENGGALDPDGLRIFWSMPILLYVSEGMAGGRLYWGGIGVNQNITSGAGYNSTSFTAGNVSYLRKKATDSAIALWGNQTLGHVYQTPAAFRFFFG